MENVLLLGSILLVHLLGLISPGPDFIVAVRNSLTYSRRTGFFTAIGFGLGVGVHISYCVAGLAIVISQSILAFSVIKYLGAGYLMYIGLKSFFSKKSEIKIGKTEKKEDLKPLQAVKIGFLTNVLNPKATLFFLSLFTFVVTPDISSTILGIASVGMVILTIAWFSLVAVFFSQNKMRALFGRFQGVFNKTFGGLLITLGIKVALSEK
jgi:RhtB (resistance to homoserine/threonine) family protein